MLRILILLVAIALLATACPKKPAPEAPQASAPPAPPQPQVSLEVAAKQAISRGEELFTSAEYSKTGLTCANCHALSPSLKEGRIYIASDAFAMARRPGWHFRSQEQFGTGQGEVASLRDAASYCVSAPYMNNPGGLQEQDANALQSFLKTIDITKDGESKPLLSPVNFPMPAAGLQPDRAHGKVIYETSCKFCHDAGIEGLPSLAGAKDWLTPLQLMAKVRKAEGDWYNDYKGKDYAQADPLARRLAWLGIRAAYAQEAGAEPPAAGSAPAEGAAGAEPGKEAEGGAEKFPENCMPGYSPDILSDQDVVDVAFYVAEEL